MLSRILNFIYKLLKAEISLKKLYFFLTNKFTELKPNINTYNFDNLNNLNKNIKNLEIDIKNINVKKFNRLYVLIKQKDIKYNVNLNNSIDLSKFNFPSIKEILLIYYNMVRWRYSDFFGYIIQLRDYILLLTTKINLILSQEFSIKTEIKLNKLDKDEIELDRKIRTTEEIIEICPYIHSTQKKILYKIPVIKTPLYKSYFSEEYITEFKETLAKQGKTRKSNIEIINIYDKFNLSNYSSIKQDSKGKNLICYLNEQYKINDNDLYYLVIGSRRDNKEIITALYHL